MKKFSLIFVLMALMAQTASADLIKDAVYKHAVVAFGAVGAAYEVELDVSDHMKLLDIANDTDGDLYLSFDGTNDQYFIPANTVLTINYSIQASRENRDPQLKHTGGAPTTGNVYLSAVQ